jgi:TIR domain
MARDVFVSYSAVDKVIADAVCATLEAQRIRCWIAPRDVQAGPYPKSIMEGIQGSRVLVLILSTGSNASTHVMREVERAVNCEIPVIPFRIEDVSLSSSMEYLVGPVHWIDALTPPLEQHLGSLTRVAGALLAEVSGVETSASPPISENSSFGDRVGSASPATEAGRPRSTTVDDAPQGPQQHTPVGPSPEISGTVQGQPSRASNASADRKSGPHRFLGALHVISGLLISSIALESLRISQSASHSYGYYLGFGKEIAFCFTPLAVLQIGAGLGLLTSISRNSRLASGCAAVNVGCALLFWIWTNTGQSMAGLAMQMNYKWSFLTLFSIVVALNAGLFLWQLRDRMSRVAGGSGQARSPTDQHARRPS